MNLSRILQVLVAIVVATAGCYFCAANALQGGAPRTLACTDPQLDSVVRKISQVRSETRGGASKIERCTSFVEQIKKQPDLEAVLGPARGEPAELVGEVMKVLAQRAACPGPVLHGLNWLQEFSEDCQDLFEVVAELDKETAAGGDAIDSETGAKKCQELIGEQVGTIRGLQEEVGKLSRELRVKKGCAVTPGSLYEIEIMRARDGKLGVGINNVFGAAFVKRILADSSAAATGLRFGDQVIAINGQPAADKEVRESALVKTANSLRLLVKKAPFEQSFLLRRSTGRDSWGFESNNGVVKSVARDSPATRAGLMMGLKIVSVDGESVLGVAGEHYEKLFAKHTLEMSLKLLPVSLYDQLISSINLDEQRKENNRISLLYGP